MTLENAIQQPTLTTSNQAVSTRPPATSKESDLVVQQKHILVRIICWSIALVLFGLVVAAARDVFTTDDRVGPIVAGVICLLLGSVFAGAALANKNSACPECEQPLLDIMANPVQCPSCRTYSDVDGDSVTSLGEDDVQEEPTFKVVLPEEFTWPNRCCLCTQPATRALEYESSGSQTGRNLLLGAAGLAAGALIVRTGGGASATISAPYCDSCEGGIKLDPEGDEFAILFRSYSYYLDFRLANEQV